MNIRKKSYSQFTILDLACTGVGFFLGIFIRHGSFAIMNTYSVYREVLAVLAISIAANAFLFRPYEDIFIRGNWKEFVNVVKCLCVQISIAVVYMFLVQNSSNYSRLAFVYAIVSISVITYMGRLVLKAVLRNVAESGIYRKKMLVVTTSDKVEFLAQKAKGELEFNYAISALAIMDKDMIGKEVAGIPVTGSVETLYDDARLTIVDSVLIDLELDHPQFKETVNLFHVMGVEVNISLADYNLGIPNQQIVKMGELTVLSGNGRTEAPGDVIAKRILDIIGGLVGLLITGVLMLIVGPAIMIESPGPIFFSQTRVGKNGRRFKIYKFRSMYMDAEERKKELMEQNKMSGLMFKMDDDPRITKVGKFIRKLPETPNDAKHQTALGTDPAHSR